MSRHICVVGTGYVGLITAIGLAEFGNNVISVDSSESKIEQLQNGKSPIYEPDIEDYLKKHSNSTQLQFSTDVLSAIIDNEVIIIAVGTPMDSDGRADLHYVNQVLELTVQALSVYKLIVIKSTVPVGTNSYVQRMLEEQTGKKAGRDFDVISNPEFLREGYALHDFFKPSRLVIGYRTSRARNIIASVYTTLEKQSVHIIYCSPEAAEMIKYSSNAFLATKIAFINEVANLAEVVGADINEICKALGMDPRIAPHFLNPGPGYGGSCFPKDTQAFLKTADTYGINLSITKATIEANKYQKKHMVGKVLDLFQTSHTQKQALKGKVIAILGLAFKAKTDDIRESPAMVIVKEILFHGADIKTYDPQAMENFSQFFPNICYCDSAYTAAADTDAVIILTEWEEFRTLDLRRLHDVMNGNIILDTRNILDTNQVRKHGFQYQGVGRARF